MERFKVKLQLNGEAVELDVNPSETLLETLRDRLELTGAKDGCGLGACGSCTVLLNGLPTRSCIVLTAELDGSEVSTIESLADGTKPAPVQESFMEKGAVQCGFCTPGMILTAKGLLDRNSRPTKEEIIRSISSNLCRCTGYKKIVEAVEAASSTETPKT
ncbi:MAG: (2Fe-2S)-binding protein [Deltaproteobacteria bacterium]|nr:(2Fe-2S)-binding protein [Deltaproteobacteria bacterium]MBW1736212.1 (2Fe-2S)-binding protein [Deltaproteobacteria bacterium]MBW2032553.1 (2Fe-2S)-binding protein [Deltaproteobacteria bacterium]MBW2113476.1 (2Fe-2S)-binding protein [Deltaproteobacteria bacterium]MBW2168456.1 (2Fe-2S)-binding protein [Deltaproteobacteria bacterium]